MRWFPENPEAIRPIVACLLLVGGAVVAEAVANTSEEPAETAVFETELELEKSVAETKQSRAPSPYFDLDDPES